MGEHHFDDEIMRVFQTIGITDKFLKHTIINKGTKFVNSKNKEVLDWPRPRSITENGWYPSYRFHQPDLERKLRGRLKDFKKVTIKQNAKVINLKEDKNSVKIILENVNNKKISLIGKELKKVSELCRNLKIEKKELFGGSMTITSLGGIGGSFFTPIINYPEVAILGVGKSQQKQIFINGKFQQRTMLPISLSYDHRIIDGAEAARFNNDLKENLGKNFAYKLAV